MNRILSLIKIDINNTYGLSAFRYKLKSKNERWKLIFFPIIILSILPSYYLLVSFLFKIYDGFLMVGQKSMFLLNGILVTQLILFFTGLLYVLSKYYFSNDMNILVPLPLRPSHIVTAKFISMMIYEYLTALPIILPFIIIYGTKGNEGLLYWIYSILIILFIPAIPLSLASIIVMAFMKFTNIKGKKDLLRIIGYIIMVIFLIAFQLKIQSIVGNNLANEEEFIYKLVTDSNWLVKKAGISFPPSIWATLSVSNYMGIAGFLYAILFIGASVLGIAIMVFLSEWVFFDGLIGNLEVYTSKRTGKIRASDLRKSYPAYLSVGLKEIKILLRTPVYLLNSVGGVVILPIVMIMSIFMEDTVPLEELGMLIGEDYSVISLIGIGYVTFLGIMNCVGCTTFSREGKNMWIQRTMPIDIRDQIFGRIISSLFVQLIGIGILIGCLVYIGFIDVGGAFLIIILGLLGSIAMSELGMIIDAYRPLLDWDNPQKPMKQNLNVLIAMGIGSLYMVVLGFLSYKMMDITDIVFVYGMLAVIFIISSYVFYNILKRLIKRQFEILE